MNAPPTGHEAPRKDGPELVSIELTRRCAKGCWFCYAEARPDGETKWTPREVVGFVEDLAAHGTRAVSFGGGEPLEYAGLFDILRALRGVLFRSITTNGLLLDTALDELVEAEPDKVHVSIHFPDRATEVDRVVRQVHALAEAGVRSGVNLVVARSKLDAARRVAERLEREGIDRSRVVFLPMRIHDSPTTREVAAVAGAALFQSMTCLTACGKSQRFASVGWDKTVAHCSYTSSRRPLVALTHTSLVATLAALDLAFCGGTDERLVEIA